MKILAVGRNYAKHIEELQNERPAEPVVFFKPDTAVLKNGAPFYHPEYSNDIHHEVELLVRISREGKFIQEQFAHKYYDAIGLGVDFTARDLQSKAKEKGLPWALAKGFNGSAPVSKFIPKEEFEELQNINFRLEVNGEVRQRGNSSMMLFPIDFIISYLSTYFTLKTGDIVFTGTPEGVAAVSRGDKLTGYIENTKMLDFEVK
ncbi:fumarylacetoacetate hydrolase family protein [Roseivirga sp. BDSF3-8]|uniref:fumarylacetoacetate hydrolase family protein n=1 Tax=Roseivirga sp. BDSF3-8 TaxID=3241598 RepID=UPI00353194FF